MGLLMRMLGRKADHTPREYRPAEYWEGRAPELIAIYDDPSQWAARGWMKAGVEERVVPPLVVQAKARSVIVAGCGSGRQFAYLKPLGVELRGFDISPTMVDTARRRHPEAHVSVGSVAGAHLRQEPADVVISSAVLQHVAPAEIREAVESLAQLSRRLLVLRELTTLQSPSSYQWAHDFPELLPDWDLASRETTDRRDGVVVELLVFRSGSHEAADPVGASDGR